MASELERIAGRLRFLSDQAQQHRRPVVEASQKLREAANTVASCRFEQREGGPITPPPHLAARLDQAAVRAQNAVAPLTQTAELLRTFAARLAAGGAGATPTTTGSPNGGPPDSGPTGTGGSSPPPGADGRDSADPGERPAAGGRSGPGSVGHSRYGRYPTTTAVRISPGDRS